jgi:hypothetical protein
VGASNARSEATCGVSTHVSFGSSLAGGPPLETPIAGIRPPTFEMAQGDAARIRSDADPKCVRTPFSTTLWTVPWSSDRSAAILRVQCANAGMDIASRATALATSSSAQSATSAHTSPAKWIRRTRCNPGNTRCIAAMAAYSGESVHAFRRKLSTDSGRRRPPSPVDSVHASERSDAGPPESGI